MRLQAHKPLQPVPIQPQYQEIGCKLCPDLLVVDLDRQGGSPWPPLARHSVG